MNENYVFDQKKTIMENIESIIRTYCNENEYLVCTDCCIDGDRLYVRTEVNVLVSSDGHGSEIHLIEKSEYSEIVFDEVALGILSEMFDGNADRLLIEEGYQIGMDSYELDDVLDLYKIEDLTELVDFEDYDLEIDYKYGLEISFDFDEIPTAYWEHKWLFEKYFDKVIGEGLWEYEVMQ